MNDILSSRRTIALLVLPGLAIMIFAIVMPIVLSFGYSLTSWSGFGPMEFSGLENYREVLTEDPTFWRSLLNALALLLTTVFIQNAIAFILAAILTSLGERMSLLLRTIYFIPVILTVVVITKLWTNILNPNYGMLNKLLEALSLEGLANNWLSDPGTALGSVIFITVWHGFGWALLFYYSGLVTVPSHLKEAAVIDGAGPIRMYWNVVLPYMAPVITSIIIIDITSCFKQMEIVMLATEGGPGNTTQFIAFHLYQQAFRFSRYGYGNAISVLFVIIALTFTLVMKRALRRGNWNA